MHKKLNEIASFNPGTKQAQFSPAPQSWAAYQIQSGGFQLVIKINLIGGRNHAPNGTTANIIGFVFIRLNDDTPE